MIHSFVLHNFWFLHSAAGNILPLNSMLNNQDMHRYMIHSPATVFLIVRKPPDTSPRAASLNTLLLVLVAYHLLHLGVGQRVQEGGPEVAEGVLHSRHLVVGCGRRAGRSWSIVPPWRTLHPARGRCTAAWRSPRGCCSLQPGPTRTGQPAQIWFWHWHCFSTRQTSSSPDWCF